MTLNTQALQRITTPKQPRIGETGEHILANKRKARTTAKLAAFVAGQAVSPSVQRDLDIIAGRVS